MLVVINTKNSKLDWTAKGSNRVAQNVFNLISTYLYEVAYDRTLGIDRSFVDRPSPLSIPQVTSQIYEIVAEREPRATVKSVDFIEVDNEGDLQFEVVIDV